MKKSDFTGWRDVFKFSFIQGIKNKSFRSTMIFLFLLTFLSLPILGFFNSRGETLPETSAVENVYIFDNTGLSIDYSDVFDDPRYENVMTHVSVEGDGADEIKRLENAESSNDIIITVEGSETGEFIINLVKSASTGFSAEDATTLSNDFEKYFTDAKRNLMDITPQQMEYISKDFATSVKFGAIDENGQLNVEAKVKAEGISMAEYTILLVGIILVMLFVNLSGGQIANSVVTEKANRVIEYLMINVRPMALIVGKILAALLTVVLQLIIMALGYILGKGVSNVLFPATDSSSENAFAMFFKALSEVSLPSLAVIILIILFGVLFFSIIAGLAGASVSKMEEMAEGMKLYQGFLMVGSYTGIFLCIVQMTGRISPSIVKALCIFPISAPFTVPANMLLGKIDPAVGLAGVILLAILTVVLFVFTSRVYEAMIFYNGKTLKARDIIMLAKNKNNGGKEEKTNE